MHSTHEHRCAFLPRHTNTGVHCPHRPLQAHRASVTTLDVHVATGSEGLCTLCLEGCHHELGTQVGRWGVPWEG